jgi:hypothetical protein
LLTTCRVLASPRLVKHFNIITIGNRTVHMKVSTRKAATHANTDLYRYNEPHFTIYQVSTFVYIDIPSHQQQSSSCFSPLLFYSINTKLSTHTNDYCVSTCAPSTPGRITVYTFVLPLIPKTNYQVNIRFASIRCALLVTLSLNEQCSPLAIIMCIVVLQQLVSVRLNELPCSIRVQLRTNYQVTFVPFHINQATTHSPVDESSKLTFVPLHSISYVQLLRTNQSYLFILLQ